MSALRICLLGLDNLSVLCPSIAKMPPAGEPVQQTLLAQALVRRRFDVSMVVADLGQEDGTAYNGIKTFRAFKPDAGIPILRFIHPRSTGLMSALRRADADVYYTSCASPAVAHVALIAAERGARAVFRVASDSDCKPGELLIRHWRDRKLYEFGLARMDTILVQSDHQRILLERNYGLKSKLASMFVPPANEVLPFDARSTHALWVSNIRHVKRPDVLLEVAESLPDLAFRMVGGPLPGELQDYARAQHAASSMTNVTFSGPVPFVDTAAAYGASRVLVNTSDVEGFPNSYLQAWSHGAPVVAFFDPDGVIAREGLGAAVKTREQMRDALRRLTLDRAVWARTSQRCLSFMAKHYGEDAVLSPYLQAFGHTPSGH